MRLDFPLLAEVSLMKRETDLERGGDNVRSAGFMEDLLVLSLLFVVDEVRGAAITASTAYTPPRNLKPPQ